MVQESVLKREIAAKTGMSVQGVNAVIKSMRDLIYKHLAEGETVNIAGLGKFFMRAQPARKAYSRKLKRVVDAPPRLKVKFKPSEMLKRAAEREV